MAYDPSVFVNVPEGEQPPPGAPDLDAAEFNKIGAGIKAAHDDIALLDGRVDTLEAAPGGAGDVTEAELAAGLATKADTGHSHTDLLDQATGDNRYILQAVAETFAQADATTTALAGKQPLDADLTALAGLDSATAGAVASDGSGWVKKTYAQLKTALGLGNVDNTADANKPISTATQAALNTKANTSTRPLNAADFGAVGDGDAAAGTGTDNYAALRDAALAAETAGRALYIPKGVYRVTNTVPLPSRVTIFGDDPQHVTIFQTTAGRPVIASKNWLTLFGGAPGGRSILRDLTVRGATGTTAHGVVLRDYYSTVENVVAQACGGDGVRVDAFNEAGTVIGFTMVENHYRKILTDQCLGYGFNQVTNNPLLTDSFLADTVTRGVAGALGGINVPYSAGWQITNIHTYGPFAGAGAIVNRMWGTVLDGAQIEHGWTGSGLKLEGFQRAGMIDNIHIALSDTGGVMLDAKKHAAYPGAGPVIGSLSLVSSYAVAGTGITWDTNTAPLLCSAMLISGENTAGITPIGGFGAPSIRVVNREWADTGLRRVLHNGTTYPARPAGTAAGLVDWVGPTEPTAWLDGDTWTQTA